MIRNVWIFWNFLLRIRLFTFALATKKILEVRSLINKNVSISFLLQMLVLFTTLQIDK